MDGNLFENNKNISRGRMNLLLEKLNERHSDLVIFPRYSNYHYLCLPLKNVKYIYLYIEIPFDKKNQLIDTLFFDFEVALINRKGNLLRHSDYDGINTKIFNSDHIDTFLYDLEFIKAYYDSEGLFD